uniref:Prosaposin n=1 Tax=Geotrypetes seraphini TaxID=260995 RepID=A0A6P8QLP8_GEOSA|nr:prosaposin-like isoform X2 [Geotrypetes seraphini]
MKQLLLLLPALLTGVVALPLLGKEQCAKGPEIWCQNIHTASQCGAVNHCQQMVWNKPTVNNTLLMKLSPECIVCELYMTEVGKSLENNTIKERIIDKLEYVCIFLPIPLSSLEDCVSIAFLYANVILGILVEEARPERACSKLGYCPKNKLFLVERITPEQLSSGEFSTIRKLIVNYFDILLEKNENVLHEVCNFLQSSAQEQERIKQELEYVCIFLPRSSLEMCMSIAFLYADAILGILVEEARPKRACSKLGNCPKNKLFPVERITPEQLSSGEFCTIRKLIVNYFDILLEKNENVLHEVCNFLQSSAQEQNNTLLMKLSPECIVCKLYMTEVGKFLENSIIKERIKQELEYVCIFLPRCSLEVCMSIAFLCTDAILSILVEETRPEHACSKLGYCPKNKLFLVERITPEQLSSGEFSTIRKLIVNYFDILLEKNENVLHEVCNFLQSSAQEQNNTLLMKLSPECIVCKLYMTEVGKLLENNIIKERIKQELEYVCNFLPRSSLEVCMSIAFLYTDAILRILVEEARPEHACSKLGYCPKNQLFLVERITPEQLSSGEFSTIRKLIVNYFDILLEKNENVLHEVCNFLQSSAQEQNNTLLMKLSPDCIVCKLYMTEVGKLLENNIIKERIKQELEYVCNFLPRSSLEVCMFIAFLYTDAILRILVEEARPEHACSKLGYCPKNQLFLVERITPEQLSSGEFSTIRKLIVNYFDILLEKNENVLHEVCNFLQSSAQEQVVEHCKRHVWN